MPEPGKWAQDAGTRGPARRSVGTQTAGLLPTPGARAEGVGCPVGRPRRTAVPGSEEGSERQGEKRVPSAQTSCRQNQTWKSEAPATGAGPSACRQTAVGSDCVFTKRLTFQTWLFGLLRSVRARLRGPNTRRGAGGGGQVPEELGAWSQLRSSVLHVCIWGPVPKRALSRVAWVKPLSISRAWGPGGRPCGVRWLKGSSPSPWSPPPDTSPISVNVL